jgi:Cu/Ag efflux pump CusA
VSVSSPFIARPVATTLLTVAVTLAGAISYTQLPVSPLPQIDFPTIRVSATLPGASPEIMAVSVATPLEKQFTRIATLFTTPVIYLSLDRLRVRFSRRPGRFRPGILVPGGVQGD